MMVMCNSFRKHQPKKSRYYLPYIISVKLNKDQMPYPVLDHWPLLALQGRMLGWIALVVCAVHKHALTGIKVAHIFELHHQLCKQAKGISQPCTGAIDILLTLLLAKFMLLSACYLPASGCHLLHAMPNITSNLTTESTVCLYTSRPGCDLSIEWHGHIDEILNITYSLTSAMLAMRV